MQVSFNLYVICTSIISMHHMEKIVVLSYVDDCLYWYTSESLGKWLMNTLRKRLHVKFLGYSHWFMSIRISQMNDHSISVDQARYATSIVTK